MSSEHRAGRYISQPGGYRAFIPAPLPPKPSIRRDRKLDVLLSKADRSLGRLDGASSVLPNPDLFVAMYVRQESVLSSQIEGTQSTLEDVLEFEADAGRGKHPKDIQEVVNHIDAMRYGLDRVKTLPLSLRLIRDIHARLLEGVRGEEHTLGEFRTSQNWIGPSGCTLAEAAFVPPPVHEMKVALDNFERFMHNKESLPVLIHVALIHAQFETIHPFLDGNGRIGRLLITFLLCQRKVMHHPLLYLSHYLKAHRTEYYDRLMAIRNAGDWEGWVKFFLQGVHEVSDQATDTVKAILDLRESHRSMIAQKLSSLRYAAALHDYLFEQPFIHARMVQRKLECSHMTAGNLIQRFVSLGLLEETTHQRRNRRYCYLPYLKLFQ